MNKQIRNRRPLRHLAIVLFCIMAFFAFSPAAVSAQEGEISTAVAKIDDRKIIGASSLTWVVGEKDQLIYYRNGVKVSGAEFKSGNTRILSITKTGKVTAKKAGKAKVYVYYKGKKVKTATFVVKRNRIKFNLSSGGRNTGYTSYNQAGNGINPSVMVKPVYMEFTARKKLKVQYQIYNWSSFNWTRVRRLRNVRIQTPDGKKVINFSTFTLNKGFSLPAGKMLKYTITFSGDQVKRFVDLTKVSSMKWMLDWYIGS